MHRLQQFRSYIHQKNDDFKRNPIWDWAPEGPSGTISSWNIRNQKESPFYASFTTVLLSHSSKYRWNISSSHRLAENLDLCHLTLSERKTSA